MSRVSYKASLFSESVIREMTRLANRYQAVNLAQGFPDFPAPEAVKRAACDAILADVNQYAITWGAPDFRQEITQAYRRIYGWEIDVDREVTVACGSTECMIASLLALADPGDRILVFEPFYENYGPDAIIAGAEPIFVPLDPSQNWAFDFQGLEQKIVEANRGGRLRGLILNSPNNPTGRVYSQGELSRIAELAIRYDFFVFTDEIYEHIVYDGLRHHPIGLVPGMRERTITISGLSKTFSVTGWRIGYIVASSDLTSAIRKMHDFLTVGAAAPLQEAGVCALRQPDEYYRTLREDYTRRRDFLVSALEATGFRVWKPDGAYYVLADISPLTELDDVSFVHRLITEFGVAAVPGSSFFHDPARGRHLIRFAFCKTLALLEEAAQRLQGLNRS